MPLTLCTDLPVGERGIASITRETPGDFALMMARLHGEDLSKRPITMLHVKGRLMMSDGDMELSSNAMFCRIAHGNVLIGGLGIGLVLRNILDKPQVETVTVVEKHPDVTALVLPHYQHRKLTVITADILEWKPPKGTLYDVIYFDIWPDVCTDNLKEIATLKRRFARCLNRANENAWMGAWQEDRLRRMQRSYR